MPMPMQQPPETTQEKALKDLKPKKVIEYRMTKDEIEMLSLVFRCSTFNFLCRQDKTSDQIRIFEDLQNQVESLRKGVN